MAVLLPAGRYKITQVIELAQSNVVVRGEGVSAWGEDGRCCWQQRVVVNGDEARPGANWLLALVGRGL